jgi:CRISPR type IV-associated protein Csf3
MYKINFKIQHTVLQTTPVMLDSLLAKTWLQKNHPEIFSNKAAYGKDELFDFVNSDFPIVFNKEYGCFEASQIFLTGNITPFITSEKKRWNEYQHWRLSEKERGSVDVQRGSMKSANIPRAGYVTTSAVAWFNGDKEQVEELLNNSIGIGKKVNKGYGWIRDFEIVECEGNFFDTHKRPIALDDALKLGFTGQIRTIRLIPPYHQFTDAKQCVCPEFKI